MKPIPFFLSAMLLSLGLSTACSREQEQDVFYEEDMMSDPVAIRFGDGMPRIAATKGLGPIDNWNPAQDLYIYGIAREGVNSEATAEAPLDLTESGILINNVKAESAPAPNENPSEIRESITVYSDPDQQIPFFYAPDRRYEFFGYYVDDAVTNPSPTVGDDSITLPFVIDGSQDIMVASTDKEADLALATQEVSLDRLYSATSARRGVIPNLIFQHQLSRFNVQVRNGSSSQTASNFKLSYIRIQSATEGTLVIATKDEKAPGGIIETSNPQYLDLIRNGHVFSTADNFVPLDELIEVGDVMVIPGNQVYKMKIGLLQMGYTAEGIPAEVDYDIDLSKLLAEADAKAEPGCQYNVKIVIYGLEEINVSVTLVAWELGGEVLVDPDGDGPFVPVTSLEVSPASLTLDPGDTETLTATVYPSDASDKTVSWHSSNTAVATVSHGQVTAVGAGEAIITASAGGKSASCEVTVNSSEGAVSPLKFTSSGSTSIALTKVGNPDAITLEYKVDNGAWESYTVGNAIALTDGQSVSFRAGEGGNASFNQRHYNDQSEDFEDYYSFSVSGSGTVAASGNIMSLLNQDGGLTIPTSSCFIHLFSGCSTLTTAPELPATTLSQSCYERMFYGCSSLTSAPELPATTLTGACYRSMFMYCSSLTTAPTLSATTLTSDCYYSMFKGCTSLTIPPELPATTLGHGCYWEMFQGCTGLTTAPELPATTLAHYCYYDMFYGCTSLTSAPELPATTLTGACYLCMFGRCTSLTTAPELPATTLADSCYGAMFQECTSLTTAPELPATTLADSCYGSMFFGCTSLTTAPELPAATVADWCYAGMFQGCTGLTTPPELPATTLAEGCYSGMFSGCTSLTAAPELPAPTLADDCYKELFYGCRNLNYIKALFTTTPSSSYTDHWVDHVAGTGTFVKSSSATWDVVGVDGVPEGWTVITYPPIPEAVDLGLPSGLKWASFNLGASSPEEYGDYFAWGETAPKDNYSWENYEWWNGNWDTLTKYNTNDTFGTVDNKMLLDPDDDAAHVKLGGNWRMPIDAEWTELRENCTWTLVTNYNGTGINGRLVTSNTNGNSIFLPAAGLGSGPYFVLASSGGYYWSSSLASGDSYGALGVHDDVCGYYTYRFYGLSVRPVSD